METGCRKSIIFSAFIHDTNESMCRGLLIRNDTVQFADFKGGFISLIVKAYRKMHRLFRSFHR